MNSFNTIHKCFAKLHVHYMSPGLNCRSRLGSALLILTFTAIHLFARGSAALPIVVGAGQQTDRFGPHSFPGRIPVGDKVQVFTAVESSDLGGNPTISVHAVQGGTNLELDYLDPNIHPIYQGFPFYLYYDFIEFNPGLTGSWKITPTDSTGTGIPIFSDPIIEPEFLPLVEDIAVQGTPLGAKVTWTLPNLDGFDADDLEVLIIEAVSGRHMWQSDMLPVQTTSFTPCEHQVCG